MAEDSFEATARALQSREQLNGTVKIDGQELPIRVQEPTLGELDDIEQDLGADADEADAARRIIDEYLVQPDVDPDSIGVSALFALFEAMRATWQGGDVFDDAEAAMPVEGNSR